MPIESIPGESSPPAARPARGTSLPLPARGASLPLPARGTSLPLPAVPARGQRPEVTSTSKPLPLPLVPLPLPLSLPPAPRAAACRALPSQPCLPCPAHLRRRARGGVDARRGCWRRPPLPPGAGRRSGGGDSRQPAGIHGVAAAAAAGGGQHGTVAGTGEGGGGAGIPRSCQGGYCRSVLLQLLLRVLPLRVLLRGTATCYPLVPAPLLPWSSSWAGQGAAWPASPGALLQAACLLPLLSTPARQAPAERACFRCGDRPPSSP